MRSVARAALAAALLIGCDSTTNIYAVVASDDGGDATVGAPAEGGAGDAGSGSDAASGEDGGAPDAGDAAAADGGLAPGWYCQYGGTGGIAAVDFSFCAVDAGGSTSCSTLLGECYPNGLPTCWNETTNAPVPPPDAGPDASSACPTSSDPSPCASQGANAGLCYVWFGDDAGNANWYRGTILHE